MVILSKTGKPKNNKLVWDLGRPDITLVTPNPVVEKGSFGNFSGSIYNIANIYKNPPRDLTAVKLFYSIFNKDQILCGKEIKCRWVSGKRILHREEPWAIIPGMLIPAFFMFTYIALYNNDNFSNTL